MYFQSELVSLLLTEEGRIDSIQSPTTRKTKMRLSQKMDLCRASSGWSGVFRAGILAQQRIVVESPGTRRRICNAFLLRTGAELPVSCGWKIERVARRSHEQARHKMEGGGWVFWMEIAE